MFCFKCGTKLEDGVKFCPKCGSKIDDGNNVYRGSQNTSANAGNNNMNNPANMGNQNAFVNAGGNVNNGNSFYTGNQNAFANAGSNNMNNPNMARRDLKSLFVDANEQQIAVLGGGYLNNFLATGFLGNGFCVVSDKRVYFRGKCYYKSGNDYKSTSEERTVDLKDITGTGFVEARYFLLKIAGFLSLIWAAFDIISCLTDPYAQKYFFVNVVLIGILPAIICWALYYFMKMKVFEISFAGGRIAFLASNYNMAEMQDFQKLLRKAKDNYTPAPQYIVNTPTPASSSSVADELKKYKELLDSGVITQEDFDKLKNQLLNK